MSGRYKGRIRKERWAKRKMKEVLGIVGIGRMLMKEIRERQNRWLDQVYGDTEGIYRGKDIGRVGKEEKKKDSWME
jgi:hypothetical protein